MKKMTLFTILFSVLLVGCGSKQETSSTKEKEQTITNFSNKKGSTEFKKIETTYNLSPQKVYVNTKPAAELLLHLGLDESIVGVGADFGRGDKAVAERYEKLPKVSTEYVGKELALSVNPDLMFGRGTLFNEEEWGNGSVESLTEMGMPSFILESSIQGGTFASVYSDIDRVGKLFQVSKEANTFKDELKAREKKVREAIGEQPKSTFAYLHMSTPDEVMVYSASKETFFQSIFTMLNLDNVFKSVDGAVSIETLIETDPDYLIVPDWTDDSGAGVSSQVLIDSVLSDPRLKEMKAVKNKKVYGLDYNAMFGYGYQSLDGIESLASQIYGSK